jgi:hypothetical protein
MFLVGIENAFLKFFIFMLPKCLRDGNSDFELFEFYDFYAA